LNAGNIEYKHKLIDPTKERLEQLATQMKFRLNEGLGEAYYRLGVEHNGRTTGLTKNDMFESLKTICTVAQKIKADVIILKVSQGIKGKIVELMIRKANIQGAQLEIKALLFGESGSGKSTLLGVLRTGEMDDGKGTEMMLIQVKLGLQSQQTNSNSPAAPPTQSATR
jgi:elongation factor 1-alpha